MNLADIQTMKALKIAKQNTDFKNGFDSYGFFVKPADFTPTLPCNVWRDSTGKLYNDMNFSQYKGGTQIYVSKTSGNDTTGNGTSASPYFSLRQALTVANAGSDTAYTIIIKGTTTFFRDQTFLDTQHTITGKIISIVPDVPTTRIRITTHQFGLTWTQDGANTWKATRSGTDGVFDLRYVDSNNVPIPLTRKTVLTDCQATTNSWYTDGTSVWIHTSDGLTPNDTNFIVSVGLAQNNIKLTNATLYMENCDVIQGRNSHCFIVNGDIATASGTFVANSCKFVGGDLQISGTIQGNAYSGNDVKNTYIFNCIAAYGGRDGFNHHFAEVANDVTRRNYFVMHFNDLSYNNGLNDTNGNNNCFTCHEGVTILRFGCNGYNSSGPILADVNSCYSINVYCNMKNSASPTANTQKTGYYFDQQTPPTGVTGKAILINCTTNGDTQSAYQGVFADGIPVYSYGQALTNLSSGSTSYKML